MDWPNFYGLTDPPVTINTQSFCSLGGIYRLTPVSRAWITANAAVFIPFRISSPIVLAQLFIYNGATLSGNFDVGIYDAAGTKIVSTGSTDQTTGTINLLRVVDITDTLIGPGVFYLAAAMDNITGTMMGILGGGLNSRSMGCVQTATAFPLPATVTFATNAQIIASIGATTKTVI